MSTDISRTDGATLLERVVVMGDLSKLTPAERVSFYKATCESLGLNPLTRPFDYITLNGKLTLYAKRDATDQLRRLYGISIVRCDHQRQGDLYVVVATARDKTGRTDSSIGAVTIKNLQGDALANAVMKAETKAKRRVTLSIAGLGLLDETEAATIPDTQPIGVDPGTGEVVTTLPAEGMKDTGGVGASSGDAPTPHSAEASPPASSSADSPPPGAPPSTETCAVCGEPLSPGEALGTVKAFGKPLCSRHAADDLKARGASGRPATGDRKPKSAPNPATPIPETPFDRIENRCFQLGIPPGTASALCAGLFAMPYGSATFSGPDGIKQAAQMDKALEVYSQGAKSVEEVVQELQAEAKQT